MQYAALLRGINVGGHGKLPMADLRALLESMGHTGIATYIQSGNVIFTSAEEGASALERELEARIGEEFGLTVPVMVRTQEQLQAVVEQNPFPGVVETPNALHLTFLSAPPEPERVAAIDANDYLPDEFRLGDRAVYLWLPNGFQRTKLGNDRWERQLRVKATTRNWNTVNKLLRMMEVADRRYTT